MSSEVEICNIALSQVGADQIISLTDETPEGRLCKTLYPTCRDDMLSKHPWNFATKRVTLALIDETPEFGFTYAYQKPSDTLRILRGELPEQVFRVENGKILSSESGLKIKYISKVTNTGLFPPYFVQALAAKIASQLSYKVTNSRPIAADFYKVAAEKLSEARAMDAQEGTPEELSANDWIDSRMGSELDVKVDPDA